MSNLTDEEKLKTIQNLAEKHDITAYEIGKNTNLNTSSLQKLLKGEIKNPRSITIKIVFDYIQERITAGKNYKHYDENESNIIVSEPKPEYKTEVEALKTEITYLKGIIELQKEMIDILKRHNKENLKPE